MEAVIAHATTINDAHKANEGNWALEQISDEEKKVIGNAARYSGCCVSPMAAFFGGITAQEVVKFTGKYTPCSQIFHYDQFITLPREEVNRTTTGSRYDDQVAIYGQEVQDKLLNLKLFMVGSGALGCEFLKAFALMGIACGSEGSVTNTDNDNIEVSNLNRQFLFRKGHVGSSKSSVAGQTAKHNNPAFNIKSLTEFVGPDTEHIFNDEFWEGLSFCVNAVDNVKAREYVDGRCVWYNKALLESGTLGTQANTQCVIPHITESYSDSVDPPEESIPMCTLRNFPSRIEHCIEWGRAAFNEIFVEKAGEAKDYLDDPELYIKNLKANNTTSG